MVSLWFYHYYKYSNAVSTYFMEIVDLCTPPFMMCIFLSCQVDFPFSLSIMVRFFFLISFFFVRRMVEINCPLVFADTLSEP